MSGRENTEKLLEFIHKSPTCFHVIRNVEQELAQQGFLKLEEKESFNLHEGGKYYVVRNEASLIAFQVPKGKLEGFKMIASHSDAPCFKIKEKPEITVEDSYCLLNVEKYGGTILSTWLDRPLAIAGRVILKGEHGLESHLVNFHKAPCIIPNLAIHLNREINKGIEYNPQTDMRPLFAGNKEASLETLIEKELSADPSAVRGMDLFLYNPEKGTFLGPDNEFIASPRLDDTQCVFSTLQGFLAAGDSQRMKVYCVFDHEEVGSRTRQGADSDFLQVTLERILRALGRENELSQLLADSFLLSADNGHGLHPNYPQKSDPVNRPILNGGIVIKYHGNQQYTTDGVSGAVVKDICIQEGIPYQTYHNRSDIAGGSTLGNISISHVSVLSADVGLAQLAMHSSYETGGALDTEYMIRLAKAFYEWKGHILV